MNGNARQDTQDTDSPVTDDNGRRREARGTDLGPFVPAIFTIFLFIVSCAFLASAYDPFEPVKTAAIRITCLGLIFAWAMCALHARSMAWLRTPAGIPMAMLLAWCATSIFYTNHVFLTINELLKLASVFVLYFFIVQFVKEKKQIVSLLTGAMLVSIVVAIFGVLELRGVDWFPWDHLLVNRFFSVFSAYDKAGFLPMHWANNLYGRVSSTVGNPVYVAGYVLLLLPAALALFISAAGRARAALMFAALTGLVFLLISGFSRSAWAVCAVTLALFAVLSLLYVPGAVLRKAFVRIVLFFILVAAMVAVFSRQSGPEGAGYSVAERVSGFSPSSDASALQRELIWKTTWKIVESNPLRGIGLGTFQTAYPYFQKAFFKYPKWLPHICFPDRAHNDFLEMWAETGLVGLVIFVVVILSILRTGFISPAIVRARGDGEAGLLTAALVSGLLGVVLYSQFQFPFHVETTAAHFWVFAGLLAALEARVIRGKQPAGLFDFSRGAGGGFTDLSFQVFSGLILLLLLFMAGGAALKPLRASLYTERALRLENGSQPGYVLDLLEAAHAANPHDHPLCSESALLLFNRSKASATPDLKGFYFSRAMRLTNECLLLFPNDSQTWDMLGRAYLDMNMPDKAANVYEKSVGLNPLSAGTFYNLGIAYSVSGKYNESINALKRSIELSPDFALAYENLGSAFKKAGMADAALAAYRQAVALEPGLAAVYNAIGSIMADRKDIREAEKNYLEAIRLDPELLDAKGNLAILYYNNGQAARAEPILLNVINGAMSRRLPLAQIALYHLGELYETQGRHEYAVSAWRRALQLAPDDKWVQKRINEVSNKHEAVK